MEVSGQEERDPEKWRKAVFHLPTAAQEASLRLQHLLADHYKKILQATGSAQAGRGADRHGDGLLPEPSDGPDHEPDGGLVVHGVVGGVVLPEEVVDGPGPYAC